MKKTIAASLLLVLILALVSCSMPFGAISLKSSIEYGKRYMQGENDFYVFNADGTGYHEYKRVESKYTLSGRIEFVWRGASDGAVYLFKTQEHYNTDHTEGKTLSLAEEPLYFGEDFFVYSYVSGNVFGSSFVSGSTSTYTTKYIVEGSALAGLVKK